MNLKGKVGKALCIAFTFRDDGDLVICTKLCVIANEELKKEILDEAHNSAYIMHPGGT